jgi:hypothetical protein
LALLHLYPQVSYAKMQPILEISFRLFYLTGETATVRATNTPLDLFYKE